MEQAKMAAAATTTFFSTDVPFIYYINLDRSPDRNSRLLADFAARGITRFERIRAVDRNTEFDRHFVFPSPAVRAAITPPEWGCLASHLRTLLRIASGPAAAALVLEDDIDFSLIDSFAPHVTWKTFAEEYIAPLGEFDIVQLSTAQLVGGQSPVITRALPKTRWNWSTGAYLVTRAFAARITSTFYDAASDRFVLPAAATRETLVADAFVYYCIPGARLWLAPVFPMLPVPSTIAGNGGHIQRMGFTASFPALM